MDVWILCLFEIDPKITLIMLDIEKESIEENGGKEKKGGGRLTECK